MSSLQRLRALAAVDVLRRYRVKAENLLRPGTGQWPARAGARCGRLGGQAEMARALTNKLLHDPVCS